jgi:hypothetical protein
MLEMIPWMLAFYYETGRSKLRALIDRLGSIEGKDQSKNNKERAEEGDIPS